MRTFAPFLFTLFLSATIPASSQEGAQLGDYGYGHDDLYEFGSIGALQAVTEKNCCDGANSGECRKTIIRPNGDGTWQALLDRRWCRIYGKVHFEIPLPPDTSAMVCASKPGRSGYDLGCPSVYCTAASTGS